MKIYTKTGDKGQTALFGGRRVEKDSLRIVALGEIDLLNSIIGVTVSEIILARDTDFQNSPDAITSIVNNLQREQQNMLRLGADIATPMDAKENFQFHIDRIKQQDIDILENEIDLWSSDLPLLQNFILPGGTKSASYAHYSRSICRKTEREVYTLSKSEELNKCILPYLNRMSDWLFTIARMLNHLH